jgi:hypothetical protein
MQARLHVRGLPSPLGLYGEAAGVYNNECRAAKVRLRSRDAAGSVALFWSQDLELLPDSVSDWYGNVQEHVKMRK